VLALGLTLALAAAPTGRGPARATPALADATAAIPDSVLDLRYATERNILGRAVYPRGARCLLLPEVSDRLARAAARLRRQGFRLRIYDCYRPLSVQRALWRVAPTPGLVANPARGSNHNRGAAVDIGLAAPDGAEVELPTDFDAFGPRARAGATAGISARARRHRDLLRAAMEAEGFRVNRAEWWHFDAPEARGAPILDVPLAP
jgi:D-alanyl-D-alanine dipeptidase